MSEYQKPNPTDTGMCEHGNFNNECLLCGEGSEEKIVRDDKTKKLFGHCFEISKIEEGDYIPVGGKSRFSDKTDIKIEGDFSSFENFYQKIDDLIEKYKSSNLSEWLRSNKVELDEKLIIPMIAFTKAYDKIYPQNPLKEAERANLCNAKREKIKLSDVFSVNSAECAEIAALAQGFLQREGIPSSYFGGDVLWDKEQEFSEEHSFVVIRQGDKVYIYDPANPTNTISGIFPGLYAIEADFDEEMAKGQKKFVTAKNIFSKKEAYYGVNNKISINPKKDII